MDTKTVSAVAGTRRRTYSAAFGGQASTRSREGQHLSRRITRLSRAIKMHHPSHLNVDSLATVFPNISTTGSLYDINSNISQGDNYNNRFSTTSRSRRLVFRGGVVGAAGGASATILRITVFKAQAGVVFVANLTGSYNPIVTSTSKWLYFDRFWTVPENNAGGSYFPLNLNFSVRLNAGKTKGHLQKYNGSGAGTTTGDSIMVIIQSNGTGANNPVIFGTLEHYFDPL